jgi:alkanesulfonate monooxygenase SsuD/methylene tetrahydromethanopterin reductase-like flavin-dependent oxidoreductase (luciferase family)
MKFGAMVATKIDDWQLLKDAEELGYDHGWVPDSQMIWSDCYSTLALAAAHTTRIRLGTGVAIAPTRLAPVTAHSIASIHKLAPGRVFLGIGSGHTAMRVMGMDPMPGRAFREYLRVVRGLLDGDEVEFTHQGETRAIQFGHRELEFVGLEPRIPMWVASNGPIALRAAGEFGDGRISAGNEPDATFQRSLATIEQGASEASRKLPDPFHTAALTYACVLQPGEVLSPTVPERVIDQVGSMVLASFHYWWELAQKAGTDAFIPNDCRDEWDQYLKWVDAMETPADRRYQQIHEGHCTFVVEAERRFVTEATIRASGGLVGAPDQIIDQLRQLEAAGLREVTLLPPMDSARECFGEFAAAVIERY